MNLTVIRENGVNFVGAVVCDNWKGDTYMPMIFVWSPGDLGIAAASGVVFGGSFTVGSGPGAAPAVAEISDDDGFFQDTDTAGGVGETGDAQLLTADLILDGVTGGTVGETIHNAAEATITNTTTGETGRLLYITIGGGTVADFVGYATTIELTPGATYTVSAFTPLGSEPFDNIVLCFMRGTRILTPQGDVGIENLKVGDEVVTAHGSPQVIRWIGRRKLNHQDLMQNPKLRPVRIAQSALMQGLPERDLLVSRQHRMLVSSKVAARMFGQQSVLVAAIKLTELPGIAVDEDVNEVEYFHLLFDKHEVIFAEGAPTESLFTGEEALKAVSAEAREEILTLFPELAFKNDADRPVAAQLIPDGKQQRKLVARLISNHKAPLESYRATAEQ